ncbi:MAG: HEAT repeat domain-containing protein [Planctomycetota bacterium]|jgi:HEAT repeat protein
MVRIARGLMVVGILLAAARGAEPDPLERVVQDLKTAFKNGDSVAAANALATAAEVRWKYEDEKLEPLLQVIGTGIKHKDPTIASVAARTLALMRVPGSSGYLTCRLAVPAKVGATYWDVHLAAIRAAGELHERESISPLLKLVEHPKLDMAVAATAALGQYAALVPKERLKLIQRVAGKLGKFEKKKPKKMQDQIRVDRVKKALIDCVRRLTRNCDLESASDVRTWLREAKKTAGPS